MASGLKAGFIKLHKISYLRYNCGWYLNVLFKFSFISCYGPARVIEGVGGEGREREREPEISFAIGPHVYDVSTRKLCDWLVSPHFLQTAKSSGTSFIMF